MDLRSIRVAAPGIEGSFHYSKALEYFGEDATIIPFPSFRASCEALFSNTVDYTILAAGNSIAGNIHENYMLLDEFKLCIVAETRKEIMLHLLARKGTTLKTVTRVHSHPMALLQCGLFLSAETHIETVKGPDTAYCARLLSVSGRESDAVIASAEAAEKYGLEIVKENIQDCSDNYTRFWILSKGKICDAEANKATLSFVLHPDKCRNRDNIPLFHMPDLLISAFQIAEKQNRFAEGRYYMDIEFENFLTYKSFLLKLSKDCKQVHVLGEYCQGSAYS